LSFVGLRKNLRGSISILSALVAIPTTSFAQSLFSVGDLALGSTIEAGVVARSGYRCAPSVDYPAFAWCTKATSRRQGERLVNGSSTLVLGQDGDIAYVGEETSPVSLDDKSISTEIDKLSERFKLPPHRSASVTGTSARSSVLVTWGDLTLAPLDAQKRKLLAAGAPPRAGVLVDMLGNFARSARRGLPLYRLEGGAGFLWEAIIGEKGSGGIRVAAADPSRLSQPKVAKAAAAASVDCATIVDGVQRLRCYDAAAAKGEVGRSPARPSDKPRWFFGKLGPDPCVPIDEVDPGTLRKLTGRTGPMHAPEDLARVFRAAGDDVTELQGAEGIVKFSIGPGQSGHVITLFDGELRCKDASKP
jgi:hypothetical protein